MSERECPNSFWVIGTKIEANPVARDKILQQLEEIVGPKNFLHSQHNGDSWIYAFGYVALNETESAQITSLLDGTGDPLPVVPQELQDWVKKIRPYSFIHKETENIENESDNHL
jgi:hypothetical protein